MVNGSDVFSFAVVAWECLTTKRPWEDCTDITQIIAAIMLDKRLQLPDPSSVPAEMAELPQLICACWQASPEERPTFEEIVMHLDG